MARLSTLRPTFSLALHQARKHQYAFQEIVRITIALYASHRMQFKLNQRRMSSENIVLTRVVTANAWVKYSTWLLLLHVPKNISRDNAIKLSLPGLDSNATIEPWAVILTEVPRRCATASISIHSLP